MTTNKQITCCRSCGDDITGAIEMFIHNEFKDCEKDACIEWMDQNDT